MIHLSLEVSENTQNIFLNSLIFASKKLWMRKKGNDVTFNVYFDYYFSLCSNHLDMEIFSDTPVFL